MRAISPLLEVSAANCLFAPLLLGLDITRPNNDGSRRYAGRMTAAPATPSCPPPRPSTRPHKWPGPDPRTASGGAVASGERGMGSQRLTKPYPLAHNFIIGVNNHMHIYTHAYKHTPLAQGHS